MKERTKLRPKTIPGIASEVNEKRCNTFERREGIREVKYAVTKATNEPITATIRQGKRPAKLKLTELMISTPGTFKDPIMTPIRNAIVNSS